MTNFTTALIQHSQRWKLDIDNRILFNDTNQISLTKIDNIVLSNMILKKKRVLSKTELIIIIGRDPDLYHGLEMGLSRLQKKFKKSTGGEYLFRAVRNRGYCLTQTIHIIGEPSQRAI